MFTRGLLCGVFCSLLLVCTSAFSAEIVVSPGDAPRDYRIYAGDHLTVLEGAIVNQLESYGGSMDLFGGTFRDDALVIGGPFNISGGRFEGEFLVPNATAPLTISGGVFDRSVRFPEPLGGGTVTITGGDFTGGNQALGLDFSSVGSIKWTAHIHGGHMTGVSAMPGNSIHVYGHWMNFRDYEGYQTLTGVFGDGTAFRWGIPGNDAENVYTLHDLGELPGDTNGDNKIDITDLNAVRNNFGSAGEGDADFDGDADIEDLNLVRNRFGLADERLSIATVPEPSSLAMALACIGLSSLAALRRRRRGCSHSPRR